MIGAVTAWVAYRRETDGCGCEVPEPGSPGDHGCDEGANRDANPTPDRPTPASAAGTRQQTDAAIAKVVRSHCAKLAQ